MGTFVDISVGVQVIIAAVIGGRRTVIGAAIGAIFLIGMGEILRPLGGLATLIVSVMALLVILFFPRWVAWHVARPGAFVTVSATAATPAMNAPMLEVSGLTKRYGGLVAVKDLSFTIRPGEILGLIGPNGSGKSTAMKTILGVERPTSGSVMLDGVEIAGLPAHKIARLGVGLVFQHSRPLHRQTVLENIKIALLPDKLTTLFAGAHVDAAARDIAERVGLASVIQRKPPTLPFADLRRLELAKAIARKPQAGDGGRTLRRLDRVGGGGLLGTLGRISRRGPGSAPGRPQREGGIGAGRPRACDVPR